MREVEVKMGSDSENESFGRLVAAAFIAPLNPTVGEINDIKTAVSEAITNAIIHGYEEGEGEIVLRCRAEGRKVEIEVSDRGRGIEDIGKAMEPLYTSKPEKERSGLGFTVMESFMDDLEVESQTGIGTTVTMTKELRAL